MIYQQGLLFIPLKDSSVSLVRVTLGKCRKTLTGIGEEYVDDFYEQER